MSGTAEGLRCLSHLLGVVLGIDRRPCAGATFGRLARVLPQIRWIESHDAKKNSLLNAGQNALWTGILSFVGIQGGQVTGPLLRSPPQWSRNAPNPPV